jgi:hypothetical protein
MENYHQPWCKWRQVSFKWRYACIKVHDHTSRLRQLLQIADLEFAHNAHKITAMPRRESCFLLPTLQTVLINRPRCRARYVCPVSWLSCHNITFHLNMYKILNCWIKVRCGFLDVQHNQIPDKMVSFLRENTVDQHSHKDLSLIPATRSMHELGKWTVP